ncbi:AAA family ATPase [Fictibacillus aquaticus]|uniref:Uncharacterized protein n=1 Tax=Fictibacillus aquaticus TaxID=2021314 RepID=A0A235FDD9_9BACL|nr:AAA family ATPase [Fictibacillus aquaticus]OYD59368.1 hypothetical protein CGZ90_05625 [Fictibacillus aquaticus]
MPSYYQANKDGTVELAEQPIGPNRNEIVQILNSALRGNGWNVDHSEVASQPFKFRISANNFAIDLYIYCWRISNGGRESRKYEQRIQIGSSGSEGFEIDNYSQSAKKGLLLGIYYREETEPIIVAWETEKNKNHGSSKSCFVDINSIAIALRDGFIQTRDNRNNLICAFKKQFLNYYISNLNLLHNIDFSSSPTKDKELYNTEVKETEQTFISNFVTGGINKIIYGAPGVGKSFSLGKDGLRVTFHPEYTYFEFVGGLKPGKDNNGEVTYDFIPGPFLKALKIAYDNPDKIHTLIIEEINRANTAGVFGDIFQLLDRDEVGWSEYSIENSDILTFINNDREILITEVRIPSNLNIFATMNSADQGVFVLDSAFKRRWEFEYLGISFSDAGHAQTPLRYAGYSISWFKFASILNKYLASSLKINEDKLIGQYFIKKNELADNKKIAYKLLIYLWDDVVRHQRNEFFNEKFATFSELSEAFISGNKPIFIEEIDQLLYNEQNSDIENDETYE